MQKALLENGYYMLYNSRVKRNWGRTTVLVSNCVRRGMKSAMYNTNLKGKHMYLSHQTTDSVHYTANKWLCSFRLWVWSK